MDNSKDYSESYFLSKYFDGYHAYKKGKVSFVRNREIELLELKKGELMLDIGLGRGEVILNCLKKGVKAVGIDFSRDAIKISKSTLAKRSNASLALANAVKLPFKDKSFNKVLMGDIIEHLTEEDAILMLKEASRVLKPGGKVVIHTAPNLYFIKFAYPFIKLALFLIRRKDIINEFNAHRSIGKQVHKNELNPFTFYNLANKSGLKIKLIIEKDILRQGDSIFTKRLSKQPLIKLIAALMSYKPFIYFFGNDMFVIGTKE